MSKKQGERMNQPKQTPGPWMFGANPDFNYNPLCDPEKPNPCQDMGAIIGADGSIVCSFGDSENYYPNEGRPPKKFDMALILAAPDLLEVAKMAESALLLFLCDHGVTGESLHNAEVVVGKIDAVVSKLEGIKA